MAADMLQDSNWAHKYRILICDDFPINIKVAKLLLNDLGFKTKEVTNGEDCLKEFKKGKYHLILLDIGMPGMRGDDVAREIRKIDKKVPIIAYTATEKEFIKDTKNFTDFLIKPVSRDLLYAKISKYLHNS
jgi:CheY-like chemotaxis protein